MNVVNVTSKEKPGEYEYLSMFGKPELDGEMFDYYKKYMPLEKEVIYPNGLEFRYRTSRNEENDVVLTTVHIRKKGKLFTDAVGIDMAVVKDNGEVFHYDIHPKTRKVLYTERVWDVICSAKLNPDYHYEWVEDTMCQGRINSATTEATADEIKWYPWLKKGDESPA